MKAILTSILKPLIESQDADHLRIGNLDSYLEKINSHATVITINDQGEPVGFIAFYANDSNGEIAFLSIIAFLEKHRGKGLGGMLISMAINYLKLKKFKVFRLEVNKLNFPAIHLYNKLNFFAISEKDNIVTMELIL